MSENDKIEKKDTSKANILFAVVLGLIALSVGLMPFFYLSSATL